MIYSDGRHYDQGIVGPYYNLWFEMIEHYLDEFLPKKGLVLDAGGGTGEFSIRAAFLRSGIEVIDLDLSEPMLQQAGRKIRKIAQGSRIQLINGDMNDIPMGNDTADYVMCFGDALSFCADVDGAFEELVRVSKRDGLVHLSVNSFWGNFHSMMSSGVKQGVGFSDVRAYLNTRILHVEGRSTGCRSFTMEELGVLGEVYELEIIKSFAAPVFPACDKWLEDGKLAGEIREIQYRYCEDSSLLEFGNHLNVIYRHR